MEAKQRAQLKVYSCHILSLIILSIILFSCNNRNNVITNPHPATIIDIDGNIYHTVKIGTQWWLQENLKTSHYQDGTPINELEDNKYWGATLKDHSPGWCYYQNDTNNNLVYGKLYNWYAVVDKRNICPNGWHIPTDDDFQTLCDYLGGGSYAGGKLKSTKYWKWPNTGATNASGFTAFPGGFRSNWGGFGAGGDLCCFWTYTPSGMYNACIREIGYAGGMSRAYGATDDLLGMYGKQIGVSVRCIQDEIKQ